MEHLFLLILLTAILFVVALASFVSNRRPLNVLIISSALYFFSLYGAWAFILDNSGGDSGFHYDYLQDKMFVVSLDSTYAVTLICYAMFCAATLLTFNIYTRRNSAVIKPVPITVSTLRLGILGLVALISGVAIFAGDIYAAIRDGVSIYSYTRGVTGEVNKLFTLFSLLDRAALISSGIGVVCLFGGLRGKLIVAKGGGLSKVICLLVLGATLVLCFLLGNKNEILYAGISIALFYIANKGMPKIWVLLLGVVLFAFSLVMTEALRGSNPLQYSEAFSESAASGGLNPARFLRSNEAFASHFSLYGVLAYEIEPTWGTSIVSLAASVVPRMFWEDRPYDIYYYYADMVGAKSGQGYAIHHATGWYLNFGFLGVLTGGILLGLVLGYFVTLDGRKFSNKHTFYQAMSKIVPFTAIGCIANLLRGGIEAYKGFALEGILVPTLLIYVAMKPDEDGAE